mmetsp:Transcript_17052/g.42618  ORF Transcript_17052/g.42618 Transcript_17052/m.42618 type:complete len:256 (+) Transcript_17052:1032-1799(+)
MLSASFKLLGNFIAESTDKPGSYPTSFIPNFLASRAVDAPMFPRPITARVFPLISRPPNMALSFSTRSRANPCAPRSFMWLIPSMILLLPKSMPHKTNSLTALALAPGVLKTGIPNSVMRATGILLVPAPHLAMALTEGRISSSFNLCDRNMRAWAGRPSALSLGRTSYKSLVKTERPTSEILLKVCVQNLVVSVNFSASLSSQPETKWSTWFFDPLYNRAATDGRRLLLLLLRAKLAILIKLMFVVGLNTRIID